MSQGLSLLDQALDLARQEMTALQDGAYELAVELATQRGEMTSMAWNLLDKANTEQYRMRLMELNRYQENLASFARREHERIRLTLQSSRQQKRRMRGYHLAVGQALQ
ncbi:MAG: hypothetical protein Q4F27_01360 [Desulfovibrionaceae bacterium]|nr:hypothetical protein [Desulfovibrionaceae bacterium]